MVANAVSLCVADSALKGCNVSRPVFTKLRVAFFRHPRFTELWVVEMVNAGTQEKHCLSWRTGTGVPDRRVACRQIGHQTCRRVFLYSLQILHRGSPDLQECNIPPHTPPNFLLLLPNYSLDFSIKLWYNMHILSTSCVLVIETSRTKGVYRITP